MLARFPRPWPVLLLLGAGLLVQTSLRGQDPAPADDAPPPVPQGVEVQARGPVHEAFAELTAEAATDQGRAQAAAQAARRDAARGKARRRRPMDRRLLGLGRRPQRLPLGLRRLAFAAARQAVGGRLLARRATAANGCPASGRPRRQGGRAPGRDLFAQAARAAQGRRAGDAALRRHVLRARPLGMEGRFLPLVLRLLGPRAAQLRLGARPLPLDARRLHLPRRLLGLHRPPPRRPVRPGGRRSQRRRRRLRLHAGLRRAGHRGGGRAVRPAQHLPLLLRRLLRCELPRFRLRQLCGLQPGPLRFDRGP